MPGWERFPWLRAGFSQRAGGASRAYGEAEQNLGWTDEDDPAVIATNRRNFVQHIGQGSAMTLVTTSQVHGVVVHAVDSLAQPLMTPEGRSRLEGDGLITGTPGTLLAVLTADCVPVLLADTATHAVGAVHAGWRGTLAGIAGVAVRAMTARFGTDPANVVAAIGPCIGCCCFEAGDEVGTQFLQAYSYAPELLTSRPDRPGKVWIDLADANRRQLLEHGLRAEHLYSAGLCTACSRDAGGRRRFFSYRAEGARTGRMLSAIGAVA